MPGPYTHDDGPPWGGGPWAFASGEPGRRGPSPAARLWVPVLLSALAALLGAAAILRLGHHPPLVVALTVVLPLASALALVGARRYPGPTVVVVAALSIGSMLFGASGGPLPVALAFALAGAVIRGARIWAWATLAAAWVGVFLVSVVSDTVPWPPQRVIGTTLALMVALGVGEFVASRRERLAAFRAAAARRRQTAAEEERMRIARELHDVLAHSLSQINVQAGVGLHLADTQPEKAVEALASIKQASKTALDDVRSVLGVLRAEGDAPRAPQPGVDGIRELVATTGVPGAEVALTSEVTSAEVPAPVGAAAYRIVQEALTNVARHGVGVSRVDVTLTREAAALRIEVRDDGEVGTFTPGRGLMGMRERVEQLGGHFEVAGDHGFTVRALLPIDGRRA